MTETIKIGTLGGMDAGKTCFMLGMYAAMRLGTQGFTISADDPDIDLDFEADWEMILTKNGKSRWPLPSGTTNNFRFTLNYGFRALLGFEWVDYRGSATREKTAGNDEAAELQRYFAGCDNIIAMISGDNLVDPNIISASLAKDIGRINTLLTAMVKEKKNSGRALPSLTIAITKADKLGKWEEKTQELLVFLEDQFKSLFVTGGGWTVMICLMTLGKDLAESTDNGRIDPRNVHLPVTFAVEQWFVRRQEQLDRRQNDLEAQQNRHSGGGLKNWWNSSELALIRRELDRTEKEMDQVVASISILREKMLKDAIVFNDGQRISI